MSNSQTQRDKEPVDADDIADNGQGNDSGYYYDDATGYEVYRDDADDEEDDDSEAG